MKRGMVFVVMALLMLCSSVAWGAGPAQELISYSQVTTLTSGTYTIRFSLWDASTAGNMRWAEEKSITLPANQTTSPTFALACASKTSLSQSVPFGSMKSDREGGVGQQNSQF
jgi:hypothetical protein